MVCEELPACGPYILNKLLGPTADYIGGEARGLVEKCNINLDRIFSIAVKRLGNKIAEPGLVSPRVLRGYWRHHVIQTNVTIEGLRY